MFMDILVLLTNVKKKLKEKLSLSDALKQTAMYVKMKLTEKNTILWDGLQILMGILFVEHAMKNLGVNQSVKTFFVEFVMRQ